MICSPNVANGLEMIAIYNIWVFDRPLIFAKKSGYKRNNEYFYKNRHLDMYYGCIPIKSSTYYSYYSTT